MKLLLIIVFFMIATTIGLIPTFAEIPESFQANAHGYEINLMFSNGVSGDITSENHTINLDNAKVIERRNGFLIIDKQNDLKIIAKQINQEKYLLLVKTDDLKLRFINSQRNLLDEMQQQTKVPDITEISHKELQTSLKQQKINDILQKQRETLKNNANYNTPQSIIDKYMKSHKTTGPLHVETQEKLELEKILMQKEQLRFQEIQDRKSSRSNYILSDKEIKILVDSSRRVSVYNQFDFDLRIVDPTVNVFNSYHERKGYIDDVEIISIIKDPNGKILNKFTGNTANSGTFSSEFSTSFTYTTFLNGAYTLDILAVKYFDDDATYATTSLLQEFFVYVPRDSSSNHPPVANAGNDYYLASSPSFTNSTSLDGSASSDPDGDILIYSWIQTTNISGKFVDANTITPDFTPSETGTATFQLTVTDPRGKSSTDIVDVIIS